ncbi:MAG: CynX/NimT family MFS transporter [Halobacteriales archaeon]
MSADRRGAHALLLLGSLAYLLFLFAWFSLPAFLTRIIDQLSLSETQAGVLTGAVPLVYIPIGLVSGLVIDRIGSRRGIGIGLFLIGSAHALRGLAPGFPSLLVLTLALGVGGTGITFGLPKLVSDLFPAERSGTMSSVYLVGSYVGTAAAFSLGQPVLGPLLGGWRPAFVATGAGVAGFALLWLVVAGWLAPEGGWAGGATDEETPEFSLASLRSDVRDVVSHPTLRLLVVVGTMYLFVVHGMQGWLQALLEGRGVAVGVAATVTSLLVMGRIVGTLAIPPLSDRLGRRREMVVLCGGLAAVGPLGLIVTGAGVAPAVALVVAVGIGIGGLSPLIRALPIELPGIGPRLTATATGLIFTIGEVGGFAGPFLVGALRDATGTFAGGLAALALAGLVVVLAGLRIEPG